ncbi:MAG: zinc-ribbon domain-containing protein [Christensenellales bacterium]
MINCSNCNQELENNFEFCPYCGEAISEIAKDLETERETNTKLALIVELVKEIKDEKSLKTLEKFVKKIAS